MNLEIVVHLKPAHAAGRSMRRTSRTVEFLRAQLTTVVAEFRQVTMGDVPLLGVERSWETLDTDRLLAALDEVPLYRALGRTLVARMIAAERERDCAPPPRPRGQDSARGAIFRRRRGLLLPRRRIPPRPERGGEL